LAGKARLVFVGPCSSRLTSFPANGFIRPPPPPQSSPSTSGSPCPPSSSRARGSISAGVVFLALMLAGCEAEISVQADAPPTHTRRAIARDLEAICDLSTGNLLYVSYWSGSGGRGLAVVPGGCGK
jgi:hypothetical protein